MTAAGSLSSTSLPVTLLPQVSHHPPLRVLMQDITETSVLRNDHRLLINHQATMLRDHQKTSVSGDGPRLSMVKYNLKKNLNNDI